MTTDFIQAALEALARKQKVSLSVFMGCARQVTHEMVAAPTREDLEMFGILCRDDNLRILAPAYFCLLANAAHEPRLDFETHLKRIPAQIMEDVVEKSIGIPVLEKIRREIGVVIRWSNGVETNDEKLTKYAVDAEWIRKLPDIVRAELTDAKIYFDSPEGEDIRERHQAARGRVIAFPPHPQARVLMAACAMRIADQTMIALGLD